MARVQDAGKIRLHGNRVSWTLQSFHNYPQQVDTRIRSPQFSCLDRKWRLMLYPNGLSSSRTEGWVEMLLVNNANDTQFRVRFGLVANSGGDFMTANVKPDATRQYRLLKFLQRSELDSKKDDLLLPGGNLELLCEILPMDSGAAKPDGLEGQVCYNSFPVVPIVSSAIRVQEEEKSDADNWNSFEAAPTQIEYDFGLQRLLYDLRELLRSGENSDLTLHVGGREFQVHRTILAARSPVFSAMVKHEMKERVTGIVTIEDSDPDSFSKFLQYLYTGSVENLASDNVLGLYETADKYQVDELKKICVMHMLSNISIENFCAIMTLSLRYQEKELSDTATQFFIQNSTDITITVQWREFLHENTEVGNELFIKALNVLKK